jgi:hypothetical protein
VHKIIMHISNPPPPFPNHKQNLRSQSFVAVEGVANWEGLRPSRIKCPSPEKPKPNKSMRYWGRG